MHKKGSVWFAEVCNEKQVTILRHFNRQDAPGKTLVSRGSGIWPSPRVQLLAYSASVRSLANRIST